SMTGMIVLIVIGGLLLGIMNTALTETVMEATDLPRGVASSAYSGVRFLGGAVAPAVAGPLAAATTAGAPYLLAAGTLVLSMLMLVLGRRHLAAVGSHAELSEVGEAEAITAGDQAWPPTPRVRVRTPSRHARPFPRYRLPAGGIGGIDAGVAEARRGDVARERAAAGARHGSAARRRVTRVRRGVPASGTPPSAHQSCTVPSRRRFTGRH